MKLLFFIRDIEVSTRSFGAEHDSGDMIHELVFCTSGEGVLETPEGRIHVSGGSLLFDPQGKLLGVDTRIRVFQVLFSEELFSPSVHMDKEALYVLGVIKLHAKKQNLIDLSRIGTERMNTLLEAMLWEFQNRYRGYSWAIRLKLVELLITVIRDARFTISIKGLKPLSNTRIQDAILYVNADYTNPITVDDVLASCGLSRSHFHALFKQETGRTFVEYLLSLRCAKAAELLMTTDSTILDIALASGFNNLSHFYHVFKRFKGVSPRKFRIHGAPQNAG
jgi:AraC-like DNA-binding protein